MQVHTAVLTDYCGGGEKSYYTRILSYEQKVCDLLNEASALISNVAIDLVIYCTIMRFHRGVYLYIFNPNMGIN